jgi:4-hydroxybutyrate dehydrogenase/sulfolactaldehyde 3-reductase
MGLPMARQLLAAGHRVVGVDLDAGARERHRAQGGEVAGSPAEAATGSGVVITMLPRGEHVREALFGAGGATEGLAPDGIVLEMSTIHPLESDRIRSDLAARGVAMVDAPVGRTSRHAREGRLLVMAGGDHGDVARVQPLLDAVGERTIPCGGPGRGIRMKLVNNFMSAALNALSAEALTLAEASGLDVGATLAVLADTPAGQGHFATTYPAKVLAGDVEPDFMLTLAHKDLALALDLAVQLGAESRLGPPALEAYRAAIEAGRGEQDWTALYDATRERAGLDAR